MGKTTRSFLAASLVFAALIVARPLAAQKGSSLTPAEGLENWKQGLELGGYKSGKYNLVVEGVDKAGNVTRAAPMNIFVDPKSDLPLVSIINPTPLARVGGDLNIVGTAVDDDGVARVEVSLDGADYVPAEGGEFWSLYLKTKDIPEGRRTIDVRAVDVNGLVGPPTRVRFDLDLTMPLASVATPVVGTLVSGQVKLAGTVFDANGVRSLEVSQDEGKTWIAIDLKKKGKDSTSPSFSWAVDTRKIGDGPKVFKLRSVDMVGSTSTAAYLVFVDNTKPAIEMARPVTGKSVNGLFSVVGAVRDSVGVKSLSYEFGPSEKGDIPLTKGDPYFVKEFDSGKVKGGSVKVTLIAEDTIGNVTRLSREYKIDREADKPVLKVLGPPRRGGRGRLEEGASACGPPRGRGCLGLGERRRRRIGLPLVPRREPRGRGPLRRDLLARPPLLFPIGTARPLPGADRRERPRGQRHDLPLLPRQGTGLGQFRSHNFFESPAGLRPRRPDVRRRGRVSRRLCRRPQSAALRGAFDSGRKGEAPRPRQGR